MLKIKRAYEPTAKADGYRVLVDRIWPRGQRKEQVALGEWAKTLAPSSNLCKFFAHDPNGGRLSRPVANKSFVLAPRRLRNFTL